MKLSSALNCVTPRRLMWSFAWVNGAVTRIVPKDAALVSVESGEAREIYAILGLTRQS
jgi:hypothetical protein